MKSKLNKLCLLAVVGTLVSCAVATKDATVAIGGKGGRKQVKADGSSDTFVWNNEKSFGDLAKLGTTKVLSDAAVNLFSPLVKDAGTALVKSTADPSVIAADPNVIPVDPNIVVE